MEINSKKQAFEQLESFQQNGIPFDAIRYLYNHEKDEEIEKKIIFYLSNAYNEEVVVDARTGNYSNAALWYGIVAEHHMSESLIEPIISLVTTTKSDWDILNEQGGYLVGKSCEVLGGKAVKRYMDVIEEMALKESDYPYLFLFDCIFFAEEEKYADQILNILKNPDFKWMDAFVSGLGAAQFRSVLPRLKELLGYFKNKKNRNWKEGHVIIELEEAIEKLESNNDLSTKEYNKSYHQQRRDWESHYNRMQEFFVETTEKKEIQEKKNKNKNKNKIGRNDPCYCGSGKKYKKCCWPN